MKALLLFGCIAFIVFPGSSQTMTYPDIDAYTKKIGLLLLKEKMTAKHYPDRSYCGGSLTGYYYKNRLTYINANEYVELSANEMDVYLKGDSLVKIEYHEIRPDWEKYQAEYPEDSLQDLDLVARRMFYTDTLYVIYFAGEVKMETFANAVFLSKEINWQVLDMILECVATTRKELESQN